MSDPILVTGGSGYVATYVIADLLNRGDAVRTTVRSLEHTDTIRDAVARAGASDAKLEFVVADLLSDDGWNAALTGVREVFHTASPMIQTNDPAEVVGPAREGTLRVLRAATVAGVRRVVLTSSFAAIGYSPKPVRDYDESDWTDPDTPGLPAYPLSKTLAERAAWDFAAEQAGAPQLVAVNPTFILGPPLVRQARSSLMYVKAMLEGQMSVVPAQRFGLVDVRDVAALHLAAMEVPEAAGRRYLALADDPTMTFLDLATILREHLGTLGAQAPTEQAGDGEPGPLVIHNERAKRELGFAPRPAQETILDTAHALEAMGLLEL